MLITCDKIRIYVPYLLDSVKKKGGHLVFMPRAYTPHPTLQSGFWVAVCYCVAHAKSRGCHKITIIVHNSQRHSSVTCRNKCIHVLVINA